MNPEILTVIVAAFNEEESLPRLHARIRAVLDSLDDGIQARVLYVDDGSRDRTWEVMQQIAVADPATRLVRLSRNFGKEAALTAGLDMADEGAVVILDADGQDPPELIPQFVKRWRQGYDNVYGKRISREGETWLKRGTAKAFYRVMKFVSTTPVPVDTGDFRLIDRRVADVLRAMPEHRRFLRGLFAWMGFRQTEVLFHRSARFAGETKYTLKKCEIKSV